MMETVGRSEKCVDINIAVEMLHYATVPNAYDVAILLTGDKDFIPAMRRTRQKGRKVALVSMSRRYGCNKALYEDDEPTMALPPKPSLCLFPAPQLTKKLPLFQLNLFAQQVVAADGRSLADAETVAVQRRPRASGRFQLVAGENAVGTGVVLLHKGG